MPTPANLFGIIFFSLVGIGAFRYGQRSGSPKVVMIAMALLGYPYFVTSTWLLYAVGTGLTATLFVFRD
jgi:hypothetical protein